MTWKGLTPGRQVIYREYMTRDGKTVEEGGDEHATISIEDDIVSEVKKRKEKVDPGF